MSTRSLSLKSTRLHKMCNRFSPILEGAYGETKLQHETKPSVVFILRHPRVLYCPYIQAEAVLKVVLILLYFPPDSVT